MSLAIILAASWWTQTWARERVAALGSERTLQTDAPQPHGFDDALAWSGADGLSFLRVGTGEAGQRPGEPNWRPRCQRTVERN